MTTSCTKCASPAVLQVRYAGIRLCREHFLRFFDKRAKAALRDQGGLPQGTTMVALSGGKDSVACLHFLHRIAAQVPGVRIEAVSIDEGIAGYRDGALAIARQVTNDLDVPWHVVTIKSMAGYDIDTYAAGGGKDALDPPAPRPACGPCGVYRRSGMNRVARERGAVALATGHNLDDQAQSVLMNVLGGDADRLARLAPHDRAQPGMVPRILPFREIPEKEVLLYCLLYGLPVHLDEECPYAARANRFRIRDLLLDLERDQPGTRHRLLRFQDKVKPALVAALDAEDMGGSAAIARVCPDCGEPTSGAQCRPCAWRA